MTWKSPSKTYKKCMLPKFQSVDAVHPIIEVEVDDAFLNAWSDPILDKVDPKELHDRMVCLTHTFSTLIRHGQYLVKSEEKSAPDDLVTEMDQGIETLCRMWLQTHYPEHKIIGEEGPKAKISENDVVWYIDPVDGTSNFVDKSDNISVHIGCVFQGHPWVSVVALPFKEQLYSHYYGNDTAQIKLTPPKKLIIGAEFRESFNKDKQVLNMFKERYNASHHQVKSIGVSIIDILLGKATLFFKGDVKLWDIIAPLIILDSHQKGLWDISLFIPKRPKPKTPDDYIKVSPFSNAAAVVERFNKKHLTNCRVGHIIVTPKQSVYEEEILKEMCALR
jgi:fructose-1,6-bisphosphatase/inositol monophosphatase family enzyme